MTVIDGRKVIVRIVRKKFSCICLMKCKLHFYPMVTRESASHFIKQNINVCFYVESFFGSQLIFYGSSVITASSKAISAHVNCRRPLLPPIRTLLRS
jgi:hypothetical protein